MSDLYETVKEQFLAMRESINAKLADGRLQFRELASLLREFLQGAHAILESLDVDKDQRLGVITEAAIEWWDQDLEKLDMPGPDAVLDPMVRAALPGLVKILVDWIGT